MKENFLLCEALKAHSSYSLLNKTNIRIKRINNLYKCQTQFIIAHHSFAVSIIKTIGYQNSHIPHPKIIIDAEKLRKKSGGEENIYTKYIYIYISVCVRIRARVINRLKKQISCVLICIIKYCEYSHGTWVQATIFDKEIKKKKN